MDDESARKAAKNEVISRSLNEGLARGEDRWPSVVPTFICECSDLSCTQEIALDLERYRTVREDPTHFFVVRGHEHLEIERVIAQEDGYFVVEKIGPGKDVAREAVS
jgi:hypothetical protein